MTDHMRCATCELVVINWELPMLHAAEQKEKEKKKKKKKKKRRASRDRTVVQDDGKGELKSSGFTSWGFSCVLACDATQVQVALTIRAICREFSLLPVRFRGLGGPLDWTVKVAIDLLRKWPCRIQGQPISEHALFVDTDEVEPFVRDTLLDPRRRLPVVLIGYSDALMVYLPTAELDEQLAYAQALFLGLARIVVLSDEGAASRLTELVGAERSCPNDTIRVYWPGFTATAYAKLHPVHSTSQKPWLQVLRMIHEKMLAIGSSRFDEGSVICEARKALDRARERELRSAAQAKKRLLATEEKLQQTREQYERISREREVARQELREQEKQLELLHAELVSLRELWRDRSTSRHDPHVIELTEEVERAWDEGAHLRAELRAARDLIAELEEELREARDEWRQYWSAQSVLEELPAASGERDPADSVDERCFGSVVESLDAAADHFSDVLWAWEDARRSAEESPFASPAQVWRALRAIAEVGREYFAAADGDAPLGPIDQAFSRRVPFKYTGFESESTLSRFGNERVFHDAANTLQMQRHLTLGGGQTNNCLQIFFEFDDEARRVAVGYCGKHLPFHRQRS